MNDQDKQKATLALANSFLQSATLQQTLQIVQEKALERATEEVNGMSEEQLEEILTSIKAQEIAQDLRSQKESEDSQTQSEEAESSSKTQKAKKSAKS
tara:strand:- start:20751 stop:21044 length:294 start_codon:yes stop_codon:yes gene_type:complete